MLPHHEPEFLMSIYKTWVLTRQLPLKSTLQETFAAYAESH